MSSLSFSLALDFLTVADFLHLLWLDFAPDVMFYMHVNSSNSLLTSIIAVL